METPEGSATAKLSESEHSRIDLNYGRSLRSLHQLDCPSARTHGTVAFSGSLPCLLLFQPDFTLMPPVNSAISFLYALASASNRFFTSLQIDLVYTADCLNLVS